MTARIPRNSAVCCRDVMEIMRRDASPSYPMQIMLGIYEFPGEMDLKDPMRSYPKVFDVETLRVWLRQ